MIIICISLGLRKDLDEMKIKCRDTYKVAKNNIDGLKSELNGLFKKVSTSPAKDVLNILQKIIDLQELDAMISNERDPTNIETLDKRRKDAERDLAGMKTQFLGSVESFKRAELKNYLENQLKQPGEKGGIADQVLQIVILQIKAMELKMSISGKLKTQAQMDVIISKLEYKNGLLSDLKEEREMRKENREKIDKLLTALEKEILDLNNELSALKLTSVQLDEQTKEFDGKRIEIMDKTAKFKGKDEIISRILKLQFEFMEALIMAQGQMKADELKINELQKELGKEQERALYLDADNKNAEAELNNQVNNVLDKTSKAVLKVISQMEEIWKLQSEDPDNLNKISNLQKDLLNLISKLDDKMASKPKLQKALDDVKRLLNEKNKELAAGTGDGTQIRE
ncbi:hypothetical protein cypCar_00020748 [Cyprinus carpio]|nr:hypothetical protein cypCar_00020748 [Cyprinus carpio]